MCKAAFENFDLPNEETLVSIQKHKALRPEVVQPSTQVPQIRKKLLLNYSNLKMGDIKNRKCEKPTALIDTEQWSNTFVPQREGGESERGRLLGKR